MVFDKVHLTFIFIIVLFSISIAYAKDNETLAKKIVKRSEVSDGKANGDQYPMVWAKIDPKPLFDNDRLYQKYIECLLTNRTKGCPRMVLDFKSKIPEIVATVCAKCSPAHISTFKSAIEYMCHTRRADYDQLRHERDPEEKVQKMFEEKFGKFNC